MAEYQRKLRVWKIAIEHVEVRPANAASFDPDQDLSR
jgi:hypothetical protein